MRRSVVLCLTMLALAAPAAATEVVDTPKQYLLPKATKPITVDGKLNDWNMAETPYTISADGKNPLNTLFLGANNPVKGDADASGRAAVAWDETYLYVAGEIRDDHLRGVKPDGAGNQGPPGWNVDSLMILIASFRQPMKPTRPTQNFPFMALRYAPMGKNPRGKLVKRTGRIDLDKRDLYWKLPRGSQWQVRETGDGYNVEAAIPWKELGYVPRPGERVTIAFLLADVDPDEPLNQIGWAFRENPKDHPVFRFSDGKNMLGLLTASVDEVATNQGFAVRAELDVLSGTATLQEIRIVDTTGRKVAGKPIAMTVRAGKTGKTIREFKAGELAEPGDYMIEAVAGSSAGKSAVVARVPLRVVKAKAAPPLVQGLEGQIRNMSPRRVYHNAYSEQRRFYKHNFVNGTADYVPFIRKWVIAGLKDYTKAAIGRTTKKLEKGEKLHPNYDGRLYRPGIRCVVAHKITGDDEYARLARQCIRLSLLAQQEGLMSQSQHISIYRYLTWMKDPKSPYAPPDAEKLYRQIFYHVAAKPHSYSFTESGQHNRIWHRYAPMLIARMIAQEDGKPIDPRINDYLDYHWDLMAKHGDSTDASSGYHWVFFRHAIMPYFHTGKWDEFLAVKGFQHALSRYAEIVSPTGACAQYGDTGGWPSMGHSMWSYELMSTVTRDGRYRWTAHRIAEYVYNHFGHRANQYHGPFDSMIEDFVYGYLLGDDTVKPKAPKPTSRVTWRHPMVKVPLETRQKRPGTSPYVFEPDKWIPDKLILSSGNRSDHLWGAVELLPFGGHAGELPGDLFALMMHDAALLAGQGYNDHYPRLANILWIEDLDGVATDPRQMDTSVPIFVDDPAFTFVRIRTDRYQHLPVVYTRDIVFVKNGYILVKDRARFKSAMKVRIGPCFQTRCLGPESGPNWFNTYYDEMYYTGLGLGSGVQTMQNPSWDLMVYFSPREGRKHTVQNRYEENPWRCSPIQLRQTWAGMARPGQEIVFTTVLLPHTPVFKPSQLLHPPAGSDQPKWIEIAADSDSLTVVKGIGEVDPAHRFRDKIWVMLNDTGKTAKAGPMESDGLLAVIRHNYRGQISSRVVVGGKLLKYEGSKPTGKIRFHRLKGLTVPKELQK